MTEEIAANFRAFLDHYHAQPEVYDDDMDAQIHKWYYDALTDRARKVWPKRPYFSPSAIGSDPRSQYERLRGAKRDVTGQSPHQGRWTRLGTAIGDVIQRDILMAEKHIAGARFRFERNDRGEPMFEDFAKTNRFVESGPAPFYLYGTCDGIMRYVTDDGEVIRVGLEVKSKQGTYSKTSEYGQRNGPEEKHAKQCVCYSLMYGTEAEPIDYYVILYVNGSKKAWNMDADDYAKNPDIAVHCIEITDKERSSVVEHFGGIAKAAEEGTPPALSLDDWTFNSFKTACAASLSDEEVAALERQVDAVQRSGLKDFVKRNYTDALADIRALRGGVAA